MLEFDFAILAAGRSTRMGQPKPLLEVEGRSLVAWQVERALTAGATRVHVALAQDETGEAAAVALAALGLPERVVVRFNPAAESTPPFESLRLLIEGETEWPRPLFVTPVDVPISIPVTRALAHAFVERIEAVQPSTGDHAGHPALLAPAFLQKLRNVPADDAEARLDFQLRDLPPTRKRFVETRETWPFLNLNSPDDFARFRNSF